jgi:hypothetical protein
VGKVRLIPKTFLGEATNMRRKAKKKSSFKGSVEHDWLAAHPMEVAKYAGQYIAVVGRQIVAHGYDFEKVFDKAKQYGEDPVFDKVPDAEIVVYGSV